MESGKKPTQIIQGIVNPGVLNDWVLTVGSFLMENDVITSKDLDIALALVYDYSDRLQTLFPDL